MRKVVPIGAVITALVFVAAALAAQVNTYTVQATVSPAKAGTKKKAIPVGLVFNYTVGEKSGQRPALIDQYTIGFAGIRSNGALFPKCTAAKINAANSPRNQGCPTSAVVGTGNVENRAGSTSDPSNQPDSLKCHLDLTIYNGGAGQAALYLFGNPTNPHGPCPIGVDQAIPATYVPGPSGGTALKFTVSGALLHPLPGFDNSVVQVKSSIKKLTVHKHGKTIGYYESIGGCKHNKRTINVLFHTVVGQSSTVSTTTHCTP